MFFALSLVACSGTKDNPEDETEDSAVETEEDYSAYCNEDPTQNLVEEDKDCDGTLTADDCNDFDANSTIIAEDQDCDGILTEDDCDDQNMRALDKSIDQDCDMIPTVYDCDDSNPMASVEDSVSTTYFQYSSFDSYSWPHLHWEINEEDKLTVLLQIRSTHRSIEFWDYDDFGNLFEYKQDLGIDGVLDEHHLHTRTYDADGNSLSNEKLVDGVLVEEEYWTYASNGEPTSYERYEAGFLVFSEAWSYDSSDRMLSYEKNPLSTGGFEFAEYWIYDSEDNWLSYIKEEFGSNSLERYWSYDSEGGIESYQEYEFGALSLQRDATYDVNGIPLYIEEDSDGDGIVDFQANYDSTVGEYEYSYEADLDGDGTIDEQYTYQYGENLILRYFRHDEYITSSYSESTEQSYYPTGHLEESTLYYDSAVIEREEYNEDGLIIEEYRNGFYTISYRYYENNVLRRKVLSSLYSVISSHIYEYNRNGDEVYYKSWEDYVQSERYSYYDGDDELRYWKDVANDDAEVLNPNLGSLSGSYYYNFGNTFFSVNSFENDVCP